jgi:hypothetical protein
MRSLHLLAFIILLITTNSFSQKSSIEKSYDKFEGSTTFHTPYFGSGIAAQLEETMVAHKIITKDSLVSYFLSLNTQSSTIEVGKKGVIVLFTDGSKLEFPEAEISEKVGSAGYFKYSVFIKLDEATLKQFEEKQVEVFRLYIFEGRPLTPKKAQKFMLLIKELKGAR